MESNQLERLSALGHAGRMAVFRLLVRRYPEFLPSGELARIQDAKPNTMSVYLTALLRAGLIEQKRDGRSLLYRADLDGADDLVAYLFKDCCRGRPQICTTDQRANLEDHADTPSPRYNILFICTGNSARSIFAETILRDLGGDRFIAYSAGTRPASELNPLAVELLRDKGHDVAPLRAKHISEFQAEGAPVMDFVFTVCDQAANEECPAWAGQPVTAHWGASDPVKATGALAERRLAFQQAYGILKNRISLFTVLHPENLARAALQARVDEIARTERDHR